MMQLYKLLLIVLLLCFATLVKSQTATIQGTVTDSTDASPMFMVSITPDGKNSTNTDFSGNYKLVVAPGTYNVTAYYMGYRKQIKTVTVSAGETATVNFALATTTKQLGMVIVTEGQYEKRIGDATVSVDVAQEYLIKNTASQSLSDVVGKVAGVTIIDGQAQIRGGSGYAYGVGSRVMLLVDNLPLIRGDFGDLNWNFVPLENAEQVEVVKSAASVLYGSSALNGVINVRTAWPTDSVPETKIQFFGGVYNKPKREDQRWWIKEFSPHWTGGFFNHSRQIKRNMDLVIGGNYNMLNSYMQSANSQQFRLNSKFRVRSEKIKGLTWGVNANVMYNQYGRVVYWLNDTTGAYIPGKDVISNERYYNINIDPNITYITPKNNRHILRLRFYNVTLLRKDDFDNSNNTIFGEYQFQRRTTKNWVFTAGITGSYGFTKSTTIGDATANTYYAGVYAQVEKKVLERLSIVGGVRYELNIFTAPIKIPDPEDTTKLKPVAIPDFSIPVFRLGLNYAFNEFNNIRASWGQGFRSPSVIERFVDGSLGPLTFFANPAIKPESGWNAELGYKRTFASDKFNAYFDFALFWNEYKNMTEFVFDLYPITDPVTNITTFKPGFMNQNRERSRIAGFEVSASGEWIIDNNQALRFFGGYTYYYPGDLVRDTAQRNIFTYLKNAAQSFINPDSLQISRMLTYRMNHSLRIDLEYQVWRFKLGGTITYNSFMNRIDGIFEYFIAGVHNYRVNNNKGKAIIDMRLIFDLKHNNSLGFLVRNMLNTEYSLRPGLMEPPRSVSLQYSHKF